MNTHSLHSDSLAAGHGDVSDGEIAFAFAFSDLCFFACTNRHAGIHTHGQTPLETIPASAAACWHATTNSRNNSDEDIK